MTPQELARSVAAKRAAARVAGERRERSPTDLARDLAAQRAQQPADEPTGLVDLIAHPETVAPDTDLPADPRDIPPPSMTEMLAPPARLAASVALPVAAGAAATAALPALGPGYLGAALTGAAGGSLGGAATRGVANLLAGEGFLEGTTPATVGLDALLGGAAGTGLRGALSPTAMRGYGAVGRGIGRVADRVLPRRTPPVSSLPGYDDALSLKTPLRPVARVEEADAERLAAITDEDMAMSPLQGARTHLSGPAFVLRRSAAPPAAEAGRRIDEAGSMIRQLRARAYHTVRRSGLTELADDEAKAVTVVLEGHADSLPEHYQTTRVIDTAARMADDFYAGAAGRLSESRSVTISKAGEVVPFQPMPNYSPWIPAADDGPRMLRLRQLLALRSRTPGALTQRGTSDYAPWQQALDELSGVEGPRPWKTNALEIAGDYIEGGGGRPGFPELVARSHLFGPPTRRVPGATEPWGEDANRLYQQMVAGEAPFEGEMFRGVMDRLYRPPRVTPFERTAEAVKNRIAHVTLGQTWSTQIPQAATPVWKYGVTNEARGLYDYARDPSFRELTAASGAKEAGFARAMGMEHTVPRWAMERVEGGLRGATNAGAKSYLEALIAKVERADARGKSLNSATLKKLAELGLDPDELRGGMTADLLSRTLESSAHRAQFHPYEVGQSGEFFMSPTGRILTQFQPFGHSAWRLAQEDIVEPLLGPRGWGHALRTGDFSLQGLGAARTGRLAGAGIPAAVATEGVKAGIGLREPEPMRAVDAFISSQFGLPGQVTSTALSGYNPVETVTVAPAFSLAKSWYDQPLRLPIDYAIAKDPTGVGAALRPTIYNLMRGNR